MMGVVMMSGFMFLPAMCIIAAVLWMSVRKRGVGKYILAVFVSYLGPIALIIFDWYFGFHRIGRSFGEVILFCGAAGAHIIAASALIKAAKYMRQEEEERQREKEI